MSSDPSSHRRLPKSSTCPDNLSTRLRSSIAVIIPHQNISRPSRRKSNEPDSRRLSMARRTNAVNHGSEKQLTRQIRKLPDSQRPQFHSPVKTDEPLDKQLTPIKVVPKSRMYDLNGLAFKGSHNHHNPSVSPKKRGHPILPPTWIDSDSEDQRPPPAKRTRPQVTTGLLSPNQTGGEESSSPVRTEAIQPSSDDEILIKPSTRPKRLSITQTTSPVQLPSPNSSPQRPRRTSGRHNRPSSIVLAQPVTPTKSVARVSSRRLAPHTAPSRRSRSPMEDNHGQPNGGERPSSPSPQSRLTAIVLPRTRTIAAPCSLRPRSKTQSDVRSAVAENFKDKSTAEVQTPPDELALLAEIEACLPLDIIPLSSTFSKLPESGTDPSYLSSASDFLPEGLESFVEEYVSQIDSRCFEAVESSVANSEVCELSDVDAEGELEEEEEGGAEADAVRKLLIFKPSLSKSQPPQKLTSQASISAKTQSIAQDSKYGNQEKTSKVSGYSNIPKSINEEALLYLNDLLNHLSGTHPIPIRIPAQLDASIQETPQSRFKMINEIIDQTPCLVGLEDVENELRSVLVHTISENEGNALLLCGSRGSGKTAVSLCFSVPHFDSIEQETDVKAIKIVSRSLSLLSDDRVYGSKGFVTVKLNGLIHNNDRLALKEMARQLLVALDDQATSEKIDGLLEQDESSETELSPEDRKLTEEGSQRLGFMNYGETLKNLLKVLEPNDDQTDQKRKSLVIVLEEFDMFAQLDRQAFLYCLLDVVQGSKRRGGVCVVGTTSVADCLDRLEKRVKSRCQSRIRYLNPLKTVDDRIDFLRSALRIEDLGDQDSSFQKDWNDHLEKFLKNRQLSDWVQNQFDLQSEAVPQILQTLNGMVSMIYYQIKQTGTVSFPLLNPSQLFKKTKAKQSTWWSEQLSPLELSVLTGCKHLATINHNGIFNLEMCWDLYRQHLKRISLGTGNDLLEINKNHLNAIRSQVYTRDGFEMGWERLKRLELILPLQVLNGGGDHRKPKARKKMMMGGKRFELVRLVPFINEIEKIVDDRMDVARHLKKWSKNWSD